MSEKVDKSKEKSKDKVKSKSKSDKPAVLAPTIEWDNDSASSHCVLCKCAWGTFRNRRHHCRNCGRLVCESCSSQRFKLGPENSNELPQRVCDTCYDILRQKREVKIQVVQLKDKNLELMLSTSLISDSLINLFYLDGSTKTIGIDETTTVAELASLAYPNMSLALFEVVQNMQDAGQYKMLLPNQNVVSLIDAWQKKGQPYVKVVMPLHNPNLSAGNSGSAGSNDFEGDSRASFRASIMDSGVGRASMVGGPFIAATPSPAAKSIYKAKQSPGVSSPIYLASSAELMGTSYDSNRSAEPTTRRSPPGSPLRKGASQSSLQGRSQDPRDDTSSRNSSFSDTPTESTTKPAPAARGTSSTNTAAEMVNNQVRIQGLTAEVAALKAELKKTQQKYDVLHAVCFKSGQLDAAKLQLLESGQLPAAALQGAGGSAGSGPGALMPRYGSGDSSTVGTSLAGSSSVGSGVPVDRKISKRSSFSWGTSQKAASAAAAEANPRRGNANAGADEDGRNDDASDNVLTNDRTAFSLTRKSMSVRSSILGASGSSQSLAEMRPESGNRVRTNTAGTMDTADMIHADRPSSRNGGASPYPTRSVHDDILSETDGSLATPSVTTGAGSINDKLHQEAKSLQIMNDVLRDPSRILALNSSALNLLVRTFFCKVGEIENFCNRYCRLFDTVLHTNIITHNDSALDAAALDALASAQLDGSPSATAGASASGTGASPASDPKLITHVYHMVAAMDGVYEFLTEYHEDWRSGLRTWLLRTFDECVQLPVVRVDDLKSCVYCLQRENLILSAEVLDIIQGSIEASMHGRNNLLTTGTLRYKYTTFSSPQGGDGDIVGRAQESQYATSAYNATAFVQTLENIITTYYSVIGDLLPTLPVEIDVFAVFQMKLVNIVKNYVKAVYYAHKAAIASPELIRMVAFYDKLAQFCEKFQKTTSPHIIKNITEMRPEVLRQCNTALVANLAEQMLKLFNADEPAMSAEVEIVEKRNYGAEAGGEGYDVSGYSAGGNGGAGGGGGGMARSGSSSSLVGMTKSSSYGELSVYNTTGRDGGGQTTGIFRCSTQWPIMLVGLLRQSLGWIPAEMDAQKKVYWCILLLDTLQEFHVKQTNWLTQSMKANTISVGPLCKYVNNHTKFAILLNDCVEEWGAELSDKHAVALFDKAEYTCSLFMENSSTGVENIAQLLYVEVKDILKNHLFRSGWDDSVKCVMLLKSSLHRHFTFLQQHLSSGLSSSESGGLEAVQQLLVYICECIVSIYLELLLTNTNLSMTLTTISRLSEDLELVTKLFEELRNKIYLSRHSLGRAPHIIETVSPKAARKNKMLSFGLKPNFSGRRKSVDPPLEPGKVAKPAAAPEDEVPAGRGSNSIMNIEEETKATFKQILQPLTHVVLAVQMNNQYLPDFVKSELYEDFGASALNIWQLIMYWRKESREDIVAAYERLFLGWRPMASEEPQVDIAQYIAKVKAANVIK